jgi:pimeloyl-ACP methyl ester carboxylesterase
MESFRVAWSAQRIAAVRAKVRDFKFPDTPRTIGWSYGCDPAFLKELIGYFVDGYDVGAAMDDLNRFPQFRARVGDLDIHFVHVVGEAQGRRPLLLTHGWPGSPYEFWRVIEPLAYPSRFGGKAGDAFDLVIPSLPGFGFSGKPATAISARRTARLFDRLMRETLGYPVYAAQGGDWGAGVTTWLALEHAASLVAIHLTFLLVQPRGAPETDEEKAAESAREGVQQRLGAYAQLQGSKPLSLAYAMADHPVAQAAWIVERFHDWSDRRERRFEEIFTKDQLLTNVMLYVMEDAFTSSAYTYAAAVAEGVLQMPQGRRVEVPTAFAAYRDPRMPPPPRSWVERGYRLTRWSEPARGGHFAAMEVPQLFVDDLRAWGREISWPG